MSKCKNCRKDIVSHTGRRARLYCNEKCRNEDYGKTRKAKNEKKWVSINTYNALVAENNALKAEIKKLVSNNPVFERNEVDASENAPKEVNKGLMKEVSAKIPPMPIKGANENAIDFSIRKNEWKRLYGQ